MIKRLLVVFQVLSLLFLAYVAVVAQSGQSSQSNSGAEQVTPEADHHQHLFSPAMAQVEGIKPVTAQDVIGLLTQPVLSALFSCPLRLLMDKPETNRRTSTQR
jgi:hypothetical protein